MDDRGIFMGGGEQSIPRFPFDSGERETTCGGRIGDESELLGIIQLQPICNGLTALLEDFPVQLYSGLGIEQAAKRVEGVENCVLDFRVEGGQASRV